MKIIVNGKEAVLQQSASFEYISENPLFTEAEDYTLEITFPMKDCPQNIEIFGPLHVDGVDISKVSFPCVIEYGSFYKSGILTITSISDKEVKGQFLEGMSMQNFACTLPNVYLTDLDFSEWDGQKGGWEGFPDYSKVYNDQNQVIGWKANKSGPEWGWDEMDVWDNTEESAIIPLEEVFGDYEYYKSRRIYLSHLIELIGKAAGLEIDFSVLKSIPMFKYILVANARKHILREDGYRGKVRPLNLSLPYWTLREFFNQLALFFGCIYYIDGHKVVFKACSSVCSNSPENIIDINPVDEFSVEIQEESSKYRGSQTLKLPDKSNPDNINSCPSFLEDKRIPHVSISSKEFFANIDFAANYFWLGGKMPVDATSLGNDDRRLYYIEDLDRWAIITKSEDVVIDKSSEESDEEDEENKEENKEENEEMKDPDGRYQFAEIINQFELFEDGVELKIAPCPLKFVLYDSLLYLDQQSFSKISSFGLLPALDLPSDPDDIPYDGSTSGLPSALERISSGLLKIEDCYFTNLWIVLAKHRMPTSDRPYPNTREYEPFYDLTTLGSYDQDGNYLPETDEDGNSKLFYYTSGFDKFDFNLTPQDQFIKKLSALPKVDETKLYRYKFLVSETLPAPTNIFLINGKKFACLRLTARFTVNGMSQLVEGEFYEITD